MLAILTAYVVYLTSKKEKYLFFRREYSPYFIPDLDSSNMFNSKISRSMKYGRGSGDYQRVRRRSGF